MSQYENLIIELDGTRDSGVIIDELSIQGATVVKHDTNPNMLWVKNLPAGFIDYVEGIASYALSNVGLIVDVAVEKDDSIR